MTRSVNEIFALEIRVDLGAATADTVDAYIDFAPAYLEVVDATGNPVTSIELNTAVFGNATVNSVNNTTGLINFSASKYDAPYLSGLLTAATVRFRAKAPTAATNVTLVRSGARWSDVLKAGDTLAPALSGSTVSIVEGVTLQGRVLLERRGAACNPRWVTPLYRTNGGVTTDGIGMYQCGAATPLRTFSATTDACGVFTLTLTGISAGSYDIRVKGADTLSNKKSCVTLPAAAEINFGTLLVGDNNGNDCVNGADVSYMIPSFLKCTGDAEYRLYADTNKDGCVNGADVSALIPNFLQCGPIVVTAALQDAAEVDQDIQEAEAKADPAGEASLAMLPGARRMTPGEEFTLTLTADLSDGLADTVDAYIDFDPKVLEVVDSAGLPATSVEVNDDVFDSPTFNAVDNAVGQINLSASVFDSPYLSRSLRIATIRFRAKDTAGSTQIVFARSRARWSDTLKAGDSQAAALSHANVLVVDPDTRGVYLPFILR